MNTTITTQRHSISMDTIALATALRRLENKPSRGNRLRDWLCEQMREELRWRAMAAMREVDGAFPL